MLFRVFQVDYVLFVVVVSNSIPMTCNQISYIIT